MAALPNLATAADLSALPDFAGAEYMAGWRRAVAARAAGQRPLLRVELSGDSTIDFLAGSQPFKDNLQQLYGDGGVGWISASGRDAFPGVACRAEVTDDPTTGWVKFDASPTHTAEVEAPCGIGPDLKAIYTDSKTAIIIMRQLDCARFRLFYDNAGKGAFSVAVDRVFHNVLCDGSPTVGVLDLTLAPGPHDIGINTNRNQGRVAILGYAAEQTDGLVVYKTANAGTDSFQMLRGQKSPYVAAVMKHLAADLHIYSMGTNCCRVAHSPVAVYRQAVDQFCKNVYAGKPDSSIIISTMGQFLEVTPTAPARTTWDPTDYVAEAAVAARANKAGYLDWWKVTGDYNTALAAGYWTDIHPTALLGARWIDTMVSDFKL